ncbi:expressed unknown protein [Seminavis robusta]|uniref:Uncharacterized protein n=1 Tax=Seminavis robusta TaxID=568900 RepID=A0A9N8HIQ1_9STRA|nr:expressed unknown protein [Seminavis robusta]|eukprot:Sro513_g157820.1 n/a (531) ;mRNA; r:26672-28355
MSAQTQSAVLVPDDNGDNINNNKPTMTMTLRPRGLRSRTPRELLRKMPRRVSMCSTASRGSTPSNVPDRPTPTPSPPPVVIVKNAADNTMNNNGSSRASDRPEPVVVNATAPPKTLVKPAPTRRSSSDNNKSSPFKSIAMTAASVHKPSCPNEAAMMRKALLKQSRRKSHESLDKVVMAKARAIASPMPRRVSLQPNNSDKNNSWGEILLPGDLSSPHGGPSRQQQQQQTTKRLFLPIHGRIQGELILTGIVIEKEFSPAGQRLRGIYKMNDPHATHLNAGFHKMNYDEAITELSCYENSSFVEGDLKMTKNAPINRLDVMGFHTGRPLGRPIAVSPSPQLGGGATSSFSPHWQEREGLTTTAQTQPLFQALPNDDISGYMKNLRYPYDPQQAHALGAATIQDDVDDHLGMFGLADIQGNERWIVCPELAQCTHRFPYNNLRTPQDVVQATVQPIRAGDCALVLVCGRGSANPIQEPLWMHVTSVTSFGMISAIPLQDSKLDPTSIHRKTYVSFPLGCVVGLQRGRNWKN